MITKETAEKLFDFVWEVVDKPDNLTPEELEIARREFKSFYVENIDLISKNQSHQTLEQYLKGNPYDYH